MLAIRFFYDNFTQDDVPGMFSGWHFLFIAIFAVIVAFAVFVARRLSKKQVQTLLFWIAVSVTAAEIVKIALRVAAGRGPDDWMPLFYCSLFLYAIWMTRSKVQWIARTGFAYITMGGILAAALFTLYPSTSLALYPAWHPASIHSLLYHATMAFTGIVVLKTGAFVPNAKDSLLYGGFILAACFIAYFINEAWQCNCMFLHHAFMLPIVSDLLEYSHALYILVVVFAQAVAMFWANYGVYKIIKRKKEGKANERFLVFD